jgi:Zn-dependent peptidase ImmA (M78 family)/transcriptional regulator with XRE-family HTH domain
VIERIANVVKTVRQREASSLDDLAARSGVPLTTLQALESGQPGITTDQLDDVARALSLDPVGLLGGNEIPRLLPSVFLRHFPLQDFNSDDSGVLDYALEQGRHLSNLRTLLREPRSALQAKVFENRLTSADHPEAPAKEAYRLAGAVRKWMGNTAAPIGDLGVLVEEKFGIAVLVLVLETSRSAAASVRAGESAAIVLNDRDLQRQTNPLLARVHLAHELCHLLFDPAEGGLHIVIDSFVDRRVHAAEQRAKAFAAEFLLPLEGLVQLLGNPRGTSDIKAAQDLVSKARAHFGTPYEITANHLSNLNFVDLRLRERLESERTPFSGTVPETRLPTLGAPSRLVADYVHRAYREGFLTDGEARGALGLDRLAPLPWDETAL